MEMKNKIDLSEYAYVTVSLNLYDGQSGVSIAKKPYAKDIYATANLVIDEWAELSKCLLDLKRTAREMQERIEANQLADSPSPTFPCQVTKILSTKYMAKLNMFEAPTKQTYITLAIRPFILDKDSEPRPTKEGCTLNLKELNCLADSCFGIQNIISEQMSSTRFVGLADMADVEREKRKMELFFQMATPGQKCRIIMEKKERPPAPANVFAGEINESALALGSSAANSNIVPRVGASAAASNSRSAYSSPHSPLALKIDEDATLDGESYGDS